MKKIYKEDAIDLKNDTIKNKKYETVFVKDLLNYRVLYQLSSNGFCKLLTENKYNYETNENEEHIIFDSSAFPQLMDSKNTYVTFNDFAGCIYELIHDTKEIFVWTCGTVDEFQKQGHMTKILKSIMNGHKKYNVVIDTHSKELLSIMDKLKIDKFIK